MSRHEILPDIPQEETPQSLPHDAAGIPRRTKRGTFEFFDGGVYRIHDYDIQPPFCSFLPGVAGQTGIPTWCLYVNRGQAVTSFGVRDKDHAVAEFLSATWAYQIGPLQGFRTFLDVEGESWEPFSERGPDGSPRIIRYMDVEPHAIRLTERREDLGLSVETAYCTLANRHLPGLLRRVSIRNIGDRPVQLGYLDGLPIIAPSGVLNGALKMTRRISEAFVRTRFLGLTALVAPPATTRDDADVKEIEEANYYAAWRSDGQDLHQVPLIVDPDLIFGEGNSFLSPRQFPQFRDSRLDEQIREGRLPCAFAFGDVELDPGSEITLFALAGHTPGRKPLESLLSEFQSLEDIETSLSEARHVVEDICDASLSVSSDIVLDGYVRQNYLDNVLRGGRPVLLPSLNGPKPVHLYCRRHGDLERDYNEFQLPPHPLSEGAGNYRDILQNRRSDIFFSPELRGVIIRTFAELIQPDGYNPLSVEGYRWTWEGKELPAAVLDTIPPEMREEFLEFVRIPFSPGEVLAWLQDREIIPSDWRKWLDRFLSHCPAHISADGHSEGYWIDHWTYLADMLETFQAIFPDKLQDFLCAEGQIGWYEPLEAVNPRSVQYQSADGTLRQRQAVRPISESLKIPPVSLLGKLSFLVSIKALTLDPEGRGVEMEAGRPGWNDAMNGLPGLFGSSTCETMECARLASWLLDSLEDFPSIQLPEPIADLLIQTLQWLESGQDWGTAASIRENYREIVYRPGKCTATEFPGEQLKKLLTKIREKTLEGTRNSRIDGLSLVHTYYRRLPETADSNSETLLAPAFMKVEPLPLFLEGQVHLLRTLDKQEDARALYRHVRSSALFDEGLSMYKLNESLAGCPYGIGRARTFSPGMYENESIWLHMSYKYLLEIAKKGLWDEFYHDAETMLVPFMEPETYGRSTFENSSFISSSTAPDPKHRGRGFVARLTGSTAEFIEIWHLLTLGARPFRMENGTLFFGLSPSLPGSWFLAEPQEVSWRGQRLNLPAGSFACSFLGDCRIVYRNEKRTNTYGPDAASPVYYLLDGKEYSPGELRGDVARQIRQRAYQSIEVVLG